MSQADAGGRLVNSLSGRRPDPANVPLIGQWPSDVGILEEAYLSPTRPADARSTYPLGAPHIVTDCADKGTSRYTFDRKLKWKGVLDANQT
jgi:hypothetical protein